MESIIQHLAGIECCLPNNHFAFFLLSEPHFYFHGDVPSSREWSDWPPPIIVLLEFPFDNDWPSRWDPIQFSETEAAEEFWGKMFLSS